MSQKLIVSSKAGFNVLTETNPDNLTFSSDYDTLKYYARGVKIVTTNLANYYNSYQDIFGNWHYENYTVDEITHNLGYIPYFAGYILVPSNGWAIQTPFAFGDAFDYSYSSVYADATKLYFVNHFTSWSNSGTIDTTFSYIIFRNDLGL